MITMKIGANNISSAQNIVKRANVTLRQASSDDLQKSKKNATASCDRNNIKLCSTIGGADFDYTKEDAIQTAWNKEAGLHLNERLNRKGSAGIGLGNVNPTPDFIEKLEKDGLTASVDWLSKEMDFKNLSADELKRSLDFLSSQYAVMKEHFNKNFIGEELRNQMDQLDEIVDTYKTNIANAFANKVGGFFEENGVAGEKEKIYQSIVHEFDSKVNQYEKFMKNNTDYAGISGTKDEWLENDTNYMASELRKAAAAFFSAESFDKEEYLLDELQVVGDMIDEIKGYGCGANNRNQTTGGSEEEIGLNLAELALKKEVFNKNSNVSDSLKNALSKSVDNFIKDTIDEISTEYKRKSNEVKISADKKGYAPLDKNAINAVIHKVLSSYEKLGIASTAMKEGAVFAIDRFNSKRDDNGEVYRYRGNAFINFYHVSAASKITAGTLTFTKYQEESSDLENLIHSFNSFVDRFSLGTNSYINESEFSVLA